MTYLSENCSTSGLNPPRWARIAGIVVTIASIFFLILGVSSASGKAPEAVPHQISWRPDLAFAKVVKEGFEAQNKKYKVSEDVCAKPDIPANTGIATNYALEDCLVVAVGPKGLSCVELTWSPDVVITQISCAGAKKVIKGLPKSWVVRYAKRSKFVA